MIKEMRAYARFSQNRFGRPEKQREFKFRDTPPELVEMVNSTLSDYGDSKDSIKQIFDAAISGLEDC